MLIALQERFGPVDAVILIELFGVAKKLLRTHPFSNPPIALLVQTHGITEFWQPFLIGIYMELEPDLDPLIRVQARRDFLAH